MERLLMEAMVMEVQLPWKADCPLSAHFNINPTCVCKSAASVHLSCLWLFLFGALARCASCVRFIETKSAMHSPCQASQGMHGNPTLLCRVCPKDFSTISMCTGPNVWCITANGCSICSKHSTRRRVGSLLKERSCSSCISCPRLCPR